MDEECVCNVMYEFYCLFFFNEMFIVFILCWIFELIKYVVNVFFVLKIIFINEMVDLCESVGVNVQEVVCGVGFDNCIGGKFFNVGFGYGGFCFFKDMFVFV